MLMLFHRLLYQGWWYLFWRDNGSDDLGGPDEGEMPPLCDDDSDDDEPHRSVADLYTTADTSREDLKRTERVRAKKAGMWIKSPRMIPNLVEALICVGPNEHYMFQQMTEQTLAIWQGWQGLCNLPLVRLAQLSKSPAVRALDEYARMQASPVDVVLDVLVGLGVAK